MQHGCQMVLVNIAMKVHFSDHPMLDVVDVLLTIFENAMCKMFCPEICAAFSIDVIQD